jgi:hypothetical protein
VHVRKDVEETRRHLPLLRQSEGALENLKRGGVRLVEHRQPDPKNNANEQRRQRTQISVTEATKDRSQWMAARQICRPPQFRGDLRLYVTERLHFRSDRPELTEHIGEIGRDPHRFAFQPKTPSALADIPKRLAQLIVAVDCSNGGQRIFECRCAATATEPVTRFYRRDQSLLTPASEFAV